MVFSLKVYRIIKKKTLLNQIFIYYFVYFKLPVNKFRPIKHILLGQNLPYLRNDSLVDHYKNNSIEKEDNMFCFESSIKNLLCHFIKFL